MLKKRKKTAVRMLLYVPLILVCYILQATVFCELPMLGAKPLILPLAVVGGAMFGGRILGGTFGLFAGVLCDAALTRPAVLFTLLLTLSGIAVGALFETVLARGFPSFLLTGAGLLVLCAFCQMFGLLFIRGQSLFALVLTALYQTVYSLLFAVPVYLASRFAGRTAR